MRIVWGVKFPDDRLIDAMKKPSVIFMDKPFHRFASLKEIILYFKPLYTRELFVGVGFKSKVDVSKKDLSFSLFHGYSP